MTSQRDLPTLPDELWLEIFSQVFQPRRKFPSSHNRALVLSWVCNRWRSLIISETKFWTTFHLFNNRVEIGKRQRQEKLVDLCLQRSKLSQLDVILSDLQGNRRTKPDGGLLNLPQCFLNQAYRWRSLRLEVALDTRILERFSLLKGLLDRLESCTIICKWRRNIPFSLDSVDFLENAPKLHTLRLILSSLDSILTFPSKVLFSKLIELDLLPDTSRPQLGFPLEVDKALMILERCPNLSRYRLFCDFFLNDHLLSPPVVTHRNLRRLDIFGATRKCDSDRGTIFDFLKLPLLTALSITSYYLQKMWNTLHEGLDKFLDRSQGVLQLEFHFPLLTNHLAEFLQYLGLTPKLQHLFVLILDHGYSKDYILHGLSKGGDVEPFAWPPALHRLYFWKMDRNSTFAISSTPYWKDTAHSDESYLERRRFIQEAST